MVGGQAVLISKVNQTVKLKVRRQDKGEVELKAGVPKIVNL